MINHPAFPKLPEPTHFDEMLSADFKNCEIHGAELAFRSLVEWISHHGYHTKDGDFLVLREEFRSLLDAVKEDK
jgi:hypothetical protein